MSIYTQPTELIPEPWRSDLVDAGKRKDLADIKAIRADLVRRFPEIFKKDNE